MKNNDREIQKAFYSILEGDYTAEDIRLILEHRDEIFTLECTRDVADTLSKGKNSYDIFSRLTDAERKDLLREGPAYCDEGKLIDLLNLSAKEFEVQLPEGLEPDGGKLNYKNIISISCKDLCNKNGELYTLIQNRYVSEESVTWEGVEEAKEKKEDVKLYVLDLEDGENKWLVYPHEKAKINFDDCLDYSQGYEIKPAK